MRRLTLILSDLYLPADAVRESFPTTLDLPALEWLLRFAASPRHIGDWRGWLTRELGAAAVADWPVAKLCGLAAQLPVEGLWMATPVSLEARLDHARLRDRGLLRLSLDQQQALQREFARVFGMGMQLHAAGYPSMLLSGGPAVDVVTTDPARLLDSDIGRALPGGSAAGELRRLGAEIDMWLHSSAVNLARAQAGLARITSLWLWGGGAARTMPATPFEQRSFVLHGADDLVHALQELLGSELPRPMPAGLAGLSSDAPAFIELAPMSGSAAEKLPELERNWFAPARDALRAGRLDSLRLVANDRVFEVTGRDAWKFWRRRRGWLESLA